MFRHWLDMTTSCRRRRDSARVGMSSPPTPPLPSPSAKARTESLRRRWRGGGGSGPAAAASAPMADRMSKRITVRDAIVSSVE